MPHVEIRLALAAVEHRVADARCPGVALIADDGVIGKVRNEAAGKGFPEEIVRSALCCRALPAPERRVGPVKLAERLLLGLLQGSIRPESELER